MYPGNPGGDQVRRNCDWLAGQEVRDGGFICFIYILIAQQGPDWTRSLSPHHRDIFLRLINRCPFPVAITDSNISVNFHPTRYLSNIKVINYREF